MVFRSPKEEANPKSHSLADPYLLSKMFSGSIIIGLP